MGLAIALAACRGSGPPSDDTAAAPSPATTATTATEATLAADATASTPSSDAVAPGPDAGPTTPTLDGAAAASAPDATRHEWWRDVVGYEIFVRSFQDSNGDGVGDLKGLIDRLDYLQELGVGLVWLMPINPSPSYHGYDVIDYRDVNPEYGTLATLDELVTKAKARGIHVIIDLVLNHSSDRNPWFLESRKGPSSPKRDWYLWRDKEPEGWARPWDGAPLWHSLNKAYYYGLFWSGMPDLNLANPEVEREMTDVMRFWLGRGLAGFRVDAIRYLIESDTAETADTPATHAFIRRARKTIDAEFPDALLVGEAWTSAEDQAGYYGSGDELHMTFSFDMASALVECARDGVRSRMNQIVDRSAELFGKDRGFEAPFLTNHDMSRVMRSLGDDPGKMRIAAAAMLASPGTPFIYYGEEIGMRGGVAREDENKRTPMHWNAEPLGGFTSGTPWWPMTDEKPGVDVASQSNDPRSLLGLYKRLIHSRLASDALRHGDQQRIDLRAGRGVVAFTRTSGQSRALVVLNFDRAGVPGFAIPVTGKPRVLVAEGLDGGPTSDGQVVTMPAMGPQSFAWIALE